MATGVDSPDTDALCPGSLSIAVTLCNRTSSWVSLDKSRALAPWLLTKGLKQQRTGDHDEDSSFFEELADFSGFVRQFGLTVESLTFYAFYDVRRGLPVQPGSPYSSIRVLSRKVFWRVLG